jgi:hypothetical protein
LPTASSGRNAIPPSEEFSASAPIGQRAQGEIAEFTLDTLEVRDVPASRCIS